MRAWAVGSFAGSIADDFQLKPYILSHSSNQAPSEWQYVTLPAYINTELSSVSAPDEDHAVAVGTGGTILSFGYGPQPTPTLAPPPVSTAAGGTTPTPRSEGTPAVSLGATQRVPDPHLPDVTYYAPVGHTLRGLFRDYWQRNGGLAQFGYPLTEEFTEVSPTDGKPYVTQYFERARFEQHPENEPPHDVLLGLLGRTITAGRENEAPFKRTVAQTGPGIIYFDATGHNMSPQFSGYWQQHGGLPVYGYPISEAFTEASPTDGKPYVVETAHFFRTERDRLAEHWGVRDELSVLVQLGVLPSPYPETIPGGEPVSS